ncbi:MULTISPECIES: zeta toxin family protein [Lysobacter]|uniref:zeta toxin family protein n=1 Tax=Lysobacter TaxID=68 RepID=UPI001F3C8995|nr:MULTISPECIES: zeta toxin family protein [Lysobacter]UJB17269.1 zeta toxin family protein [Lysobacter capsici]UJQ29008.1 zeta toxin family protein [Lysobacter gummosus]
MDKEAHAKIFAERVLPDSGFSEATTQAKPRAIILAGQPGAGKTGLVKEAMREFKGDAVLVDPDELRKYVPNLKELQQAKPLGWSGDTLKDSSKWGNQLRDAIIKDSKNLVYDTTLSNGSGAVDLIKKLQKNGYEVEIRAVAAHRLESELGVDQRFTSSFIRSGFGRYVPEDVRSRSYEAIPGNLDRVHAETKTPIRISTREGVEVYNSRVSSQLPGAALEEAREARIKDPALTKTLNEAWQKQLAVHEALPKTLANNPNVAPATAEAFFVEGSESKLGEGVKRSASEVTQIDHAVRVRPAEIKNAAMLAELKATQGVSNQLAGEAAKVEPPTRLRPAQIKGAAALGIAGTAATAYDVATTAHDASRQYDQGNLTGVESKIVGTASRSVGGFGGMAAGAAIGASVTAETGPGALIGGAVGGIAGAIAGDKAAEWIDQYRITHQKDKDGNTWTFLPAQPQQGWTRRELDLDAMSRSDGASVYKPEVLKADPALADRLNFQASGRAVELALSAPPKPQNPYSLPANAQDARGIEESNWERNATTKQWTRQVAIGQVDLGATSYRTDLATPQRAAELEKQSQAVIADNATRTPLALAANYKTAYDQYDWSRHGEMPAAVKDAIKHPGRMLASDGDTYQRSADGQWTSHGMVWDSKAQGNIKQELDATYQRQQSGPKITTLEPVEVHADPEPTHTASATPAPAQRSTPEDPGHPDRALYEKVRGAVEQLDRQAGKPWDQQSERMTASALAMAAEKKFEAKDDIRLAFNPPTANLAAGEMVHVYRVGHPSPDPAAHHASMKTADALSVPVEARYQQVEATRIAQAEQVQREQQQAQTRAQDQSNQSGPKMTA